MLYEKLIKRNKCIREAVNNENGFNFEFEEDIINIEKRNRQEISNYVFW